MSKHDKLLIDPKITSVRKFYFLEYFYILLKGVEQFKKQDEIFADFRNRKDSLQLGESKYKKLIAPEEELSSKMLMRYEYTFKEVVEESRLYGLLEIKSDEYWLTSVGLELIKRYETNIDEFNLSIFQLMESKLFGFHYLIEGCYAVNRNGLLIFPIYSPLKLNISKDSIKKSKDVVHYIDILAGKLTKDIQEHLKFNRDLTEAKDSLISKLQLAGMIESNLDMPFASKNYNATVKRIRDFWLNYFLNDIYNLKISLSYFDIWCYRGKQLGIINATEFYYNIDGKIVYPISIISNHVHSTDFKSVFTYPQNKQLFIHSPKFENVTEIFTKCVYESYIDIKSRVKTYFVNLADLRDIVCFKLKISYDKFSEFLEHLYQLNLKNETKISISLEADKLPSETKAMYLKREPIIIDNRTLNIIAIDIKK